MPWQLVSRCESVRAHVPNDFVKFCESNLNWVLWTVLPEHCTYCLAQVGLEVEWLTQQQWQLFGLPAIFPHPQEEEHSYWGPIHQYGLGYMFPETNFLNPHNSASSLSCLRNSLAKMDSLVCNQSILIGFPPKEISCYHIRELKLKVKRFVKATVS